MNATTRKQEINTAAHHENHQKITQFFPKMLLGGPFWELWEAKRSPKWHQSRLGGTPGRVPRTRSPKKRAPRRNSNPNGSNNDLPNRHFGWDFLIFSVFFSHRIFVWYFDGVLMVRGLILGSFLMICLLFSVLKVDRATFWTCCCFVGFKCVLVITCFLFQFFFL